MLLLWGTQQRCGSLGDTAAENKEQFRKTTICSAQGAGFSDMAAVACHRLAGQHKALDLNSGK
eukprot:9435340-Karenia_brevis.AAC.1